MEPLTLDKILNEACQNYVYPDDFDWSKGDSSVKPEWRKITIETHCLAYEVVCKSNGDGTWTIREYEIRDN